MPIILSSYSELLLTIVFVTLSCINPGFSNSFKSSVMPLTFLAVTGKMVCSLFTLEHICIPESPAKPLQLVLVVGKHISFIE